MADVRNLRTGYTLKAQANCWDHQVLATILSQDREGDVDVDPFATVCGAKVYATSGAYQPAHSQIRRSRRLTVPSDARLADRTHSGVQQCTSPTPPLVVSCVRQLGGTAC